MTVSGEYFKGGPLADFTSWHGRPQAGGGHLPPLSRALSWKCCKLLLALAVTAKRSVDELFLHYFHHSSSAALSIGSKIGDLE